MANMHFKADLLPSSDLGYSLGSSEERWKLNAIGTINGAKIFYGTCSTAAGTAIKQVDCDEFTVNDLVIGAIIFVTFTATNSAAVANLQLKVAETDAKPLKYFHNNAASNLPAVGYLAANSTYFFQYDGTNWKALMDYDTNTNDTSTMYIRYANGTFVPSTALYRYQILLTKDQTTLIPVNAVSNSTATTKTLTTESFNPFEPIYYYSTTGTVNANATINVAYLWSVRNNADIRYSFNTGTTLTTNKDVYIVAQMDSPTTAKLATAVAPITQTLPTSEDGYIYIKLGHACSTSNVSMTYDHPIYWYKDGAVQPYAPSRGIAGITRSGTTFTVTRDDGSTFTFSQEDNNTTYSAGTGLTLSNTTINHSNSITAKTTYGSTATTASANGGKIIVTDIKYDAQGHITGSQDRTITLSQNDTDTKVTNTLGTTTKYYITGTTTATTNTGGQTFDTGVYVTAVAGEVSAVRHSLNVSGTEKAYMAYNNTTNAIDFIFV